MDDSPEDQGQSEAQSSGSTWWSSDLRDKLQSLSIAQLENNSGTENSLIVHEAESSIQASQTLWSTGMLSNPIPNGFYSVIPDKQLKELFDTIPSPDDLYCLGMDGLKAEIILVDTEKDKKLFMLRQLSMALVKGLNSNPAALIKKLASLVSDFYKRPNAQLSPARATNEDILCLIENRGIQLLGQIKNGSCRPRAILFKVLADAAGLETKLAVGLPTEESPESTDSYKHMSVVVLLNSTEYLVDLMRFPGQLIPFSTKAIVSCHISGVGESDSADYDSCDSPLEPNSPLFAQRQDLDDSRRSLGVQRLEASGTAASSLKNFMMRANTFTEGGLSSSHSVPNVANASWDRSRRKVVGEHHRTSSESPEHPLSKGRGRSMLSGDRQPFREFAADAVVASRSDGASTSAPANRKMRRRSISITPEIGDDIVKAVRAMNENMKQIRLLKGQNEGISSLFLQKEEGSNDSPKIEAEDQCDTPSEVNSQKAVSLPSSPHQFNRRNYEIAGPSDFVPEDLVSTWNKILQSSPFSKKPLLPFEEWHIDFSELTVGTRVGIGCFGEVFRGLWNGTDVAIKVFLEQDLTTENMEDFCNEISILSRLRHPNVILFLGACMKPPHLSLVTEFMEMGSLYFLVHATQQRNKLNWRRRLKMLRDICRGLMCMHRMNIIHRDLKSANCLVNKHWTVKICDFGLSRLMTTSPMCDSFSVGTPEWMAPELIRKEPFTEKCDIFSLGVIIWELGTLSKPWDGIPSAQVVYSVAHEGARLEIPDGPLGSLISDCWQEPDKRPSCQEILTRLLDCEYTLC